MEILTLLATNSLALIITVFIFCLILGSFINVVIFRLPKILFFNWNKDCNEFLTLHKNSIPQKQVSLIFPGSFCPKCKTKIKWYDNIPLISFLMIKGKCRKCAQAISWRYPLIELMCALLCTICAIKFGFSMQLLLAIVFTLAIVANSAIDVEHQILADEITLPLLWLGLIANYYQLFCPFEQAFFGAIFGYLVLWSVYWIFKLLTKKEGMGYGDFKLLAMIGAWLGWKVLPIVILFSSLLGAIVGIVLILIKKHHRSSPIPFGPFLALAGWIGLIWGEPILQFLY